MSDARFGIVLGRFQPFHLGHLEYLAAAKSRSERVIIGITNPNVGELRFHEADPQRSEAASNPFPYFARCLIIEAALTGDGWSPNDFMFVPANIDDPPALTPYLPDPAQSVIFVTVYDAWGEEKAQRLASIGFRVEILWRRSMRERLTSGTDIRGRLRNNCKWEHLVPVGAIGTLREQARIFVKPVHPEVVGVSA